MDELVAGWLALWNGDYARADALVAEDFRVHAALMGGGDDDALRGAAALVGWIQQTRSAMPDLAFAIQVGPIAQDDMVAVRWSATGSYAGGFPGARAAVGAPIAFTGTDVLRVEDGRFVEYWVNSDVHVLLAQLQAA